MCATLNVWWYSWLIWFHLFRNNEEIFVLYSYLHFNWFLDNQIHFQLNFSFAEKAMLNLLGLFLVWSHQIRHFCNIVDYRKVLIHFLAVLLIFASDRRDLSTAVWRITKQQMCLVHVILVDRTLNFIFPRYLALASVVRWLQRKQRSDW